MGVVCQKENSSYIKRLTTRYVIYLEELGQDRDRVLAGQIIGAHIQHFSVLVFVFF